MAGTDFRDADLVEWTTRGEQFVEADFSGADLASSVHEGSQFLRCTFDRTRLFGATFRACRLSGSVFQRCVLRPLTVEGGDWSYASLRAADLRHVSFAGCGWPRLTSAKPTCGTATCGEPTSGTPCCAPPASPTPTCGERAWTGWISPGSPFRG